MIEALIAIVDRLISLLQGRIAGRKELFDRILEPTFNDLLLVHGDYISLFEAGRQSAFPEDSPPAKDSQEYTVRLEATKAVLLRSRLVLEPVRTKIRAVADQLLHVSLPPEEKDFVAAVLRYFPTGDPRLSRSHGLNLVTFLEQRPDPFSIDLQFETILNEIRNQWSSVCIAFGRLKVAIARER